MKMKVIQFNLNGNNGLIAAPDIAAGGSHFGAFKTVSAVGAGTVAALNDIKSNIVANSKKTRASRAYDTIVKLNITTTIPVGGNAPSITPISHTDLQLGDKERVIGFSVMSIETVANNNALVLQDANLTWNYNTEMKRLYLSVADGLKAGIPVNTAVYARLTVLQNEG